MFSKEIIEKMKETNNLIPTYINKLKKDSFNKPCCPLCNKPLTYISGVNHVECEHCKGKDGKRLIRGYISLLMYNENLDFITAKDRAFKELDLFKASGNIKNVRDYKDLDTREIGIRYFNNRDNIRNFYSNHSLEKPLIFTDFVIGDLIYCNLLSVYGDFLKTPNVVAISNANYTYNALSVLLKAPKNHHIKLFLLFENSKETNIIKKKLINDLIKYNFLNYVVIDNLIDFDSGEHTIKEHYNRNKENFKFHLKGIVSNFNGLYKKPILNPLDKSNEQLDTKTLNKPQNAQKTPKTPINDIKDNLKIIENENF